MKREELEKMKVRELQKMATSLGVSHSRDLKKSEVIETIEAILGAEKAEAKESVPEEQSAKDEVEIDDSMCTETLEKSEKDVVSTKAVCTDAEQKMGYCERAAVGTIVAFRLPSGKVISAKVVRRSTKGKKFEVRTAYGAVYIVPFTDVVWVRTGRHWPNGVYKLLKEEA